MIWSDEEMRRASDELLHLLAAAHERLDRAGYPRSQVEETTAGTCWGAQTRQVA